MAAAEKLLFDPASSADRPIERLSDRPRAVSPITPPSSTPFPPSFPLYLFPLLPADAKSAFHSAVVAAAVGAGGLGRVPISFFGFQFQQVFHVRARNLCPASLPCSLSIPPLSQTTISEAISGTCNHAKFSLAASQQRGERGHPQKCTTRLHESPLGAFK